MNAEKLILLARVKLYAARICCDDANELVGGIIGTNDNDLLRVAMYAHKLGCSEVVDAIATKISTPAPAMSDDDKIHAAIFEFCKANDAKKLPLIKLIRTLGIPAVQGLKDAKDWIESHYHEVYYDGDAYSRIMVRNDA